MPRARAVRRLALPGLLAAGLLGPAPGVQAQQAGPLDRPGTETARRGTRFSSFDVGFGGAFPDAGRVGISYGLGVDVADLLVRDAAVRLGFRFWTSEDEQPDGRVVDVDDTVFGVSVKKAFPLGRVEPYIGFGVAAHFISARYADFIGEKDERDGFHPALEGLAGLELPLVDRGFVSVFVEGQGSLLRDLPHGSIHAGARIRFDRLGTGG
ncbi:MAG: hypothetical protein R6X22_02475 [Gemmatimonadota bacterium]